MPGAKDPLWWNKMLRTRSTDILSAFVKDANAIDPDFVVHCGDLTDTGDEESFRAAVEILSDLKCPAYFTPGNHDTQKPDTRRILANLLGLDEPCFFQIMEVGNWRLILIDAMYWINTDGSVHEFYECDKALNFITPDFELEAICTELERDPQKPTIFFCHPVLRVRNGYPVSARPYGTPIESGLVDLTGLLGNSGRITAISDRYPCVKAGFCGHGHFNEIFVPKKEAGADGTLYCQTGSLIEFPCEYRKIHIGENHLQVETLKLSGDDFAELSYVPSRGNRWTSGRPIDRFASFAF